MAIRQNPDKRVEATAALGCNALPYHQTRRRQILFGPMCLFVVLMYLPYPLRLLHRWPDQEVSTPVLCGLPYPFSLWGMIPVSTSLIVMVTDLGAAVFHVW